VFREKEFDKMMKDINIITILTIIDGSNSREGVSCVRVLCLLLIWKVFMILTTEEYSECGGINAKNAR
jgi:hypothetical protein